MPPNTSPKRYLIDTCCFMDLDSIHPRSQFRCSPAERTKIWKALVSLGKAQRVFTITHIIEELKRHYPKPLPSDFQALPLIKTGLSAPDVAVEVSNLLSKHPSLLKPSVRHTRDPADPWIIAVAQMNGLTVVSNEKPRKGIGKYKIPDACKAIGIECITFSEFIAQEAILP